MLQGGHGVPAPPATRIQPCSAMAGSDAALAPRPRGEPPYGVAGVVRPQRDEHRACNLEPDHAGAPRRDHKAQPGRRAQGLERVPGRRREAVDRQSHDQFVGVRDDDGPSGLEFSDAALNRNVVGRAEKAEPPWYVFQLHPIPLRWQRGP